MLCKRSQLLALHGRIQKHRVFLWRGGRLVQKMGVQSHLLFLPGMAASRGRQIQHHRNGDAGHRRGCVSDAGSTVSRGTGQLAVPAAVRRQSVSLGARAELAACEVGGDAIFGIPSVWYGVESQEVALLLPCIQRME